MSTTIPAVDAIDAILGDDAAGVAGLRARHPQHVAQLQAYHDAVFAPNAWSGEAFPAAHRALVAVRVASHTRSAAVSAWYAAIARTAGAGDAAIAAAADVASAWGGETPLDAAIRHADKLTIAPDTTRQADLDALAAAGLTPGAILALSQTVAFVSYQLRLVALLRALGGRS